MSDNEMIQNELDEEENGNGTSDTLEEGIRIPITLEIPKDLPALYSNHFAVQHTDREFILYFFDVWLPLIIGAEEEIRAELEKVEALEARCLARIVIAPDKMKDIIEHLQDNFEKYQRRMAKKEGKS